MANLWKRFPLVNEDLSPNIGRITVFSIAVAAWSTICLAVLAKTALIPAPTAQNGYIALI